MNLTKLFLLPLLVTFAFSIATPVFAGDDCVSCGTGLPGGVENKVDPELTLLICAGFDAGQLDSVRKDGIQFFGSVENLYSVMHQMQCPPNAPSPIYSGIYVAATADGYPQMFRDLAKLSPEVRARLLNRPTKGRRTETILDLVDRRIKANRSMKATGGQEELMGYLQEMRRKFVELGAKKFSEMTPEELAIYQ